MGLNSDLDMEPEHKSKSEMIGEPQREAEWGPGSGQWFESDTDPNQNPKLNKVAFACRSTKEQAYLGLMGSCPCRLSADEMAETTFQTLRAGVDADLP